MAVFKLTIRGCDGKPRLVKADSRAQAVAHIVDAETVNANELADLIADGAKIERAGDLPPEPADKSEEKPADPPVDNGGKKS